jgi:arginyl-tRNA synthetase
MYKKIFEKDIQTYLDNNSFNFKTVIDYSDYEDYQYQSPILFNLKKQKSFKIEEFISFLQETNHYEKIESTGPGFLSVKFKLMNSFPYPISPSQKVVVDYCGVNVAKQMHIGHIRSMFIGDFIVRTHKDDEVIIYNHVGDWGNQFGFLLQYIKDNNLPVEDNKALTQYYKASYALYQADPVFKKKADECAYSLHSKNPEIMSLWTQCVKTSLKEAQNIFTIFNLKIDINDTQGESFYADMCPVIEKYLVDAGIAQPQEDGSVVSFFKDKTPLILKKSTGSYLYAMYDLAAIKWRNDNINPDKIIYVVDKRQSLHFEQVFDIAQQMKWAKPQSLLHVGFGTILGKDKKPLKTKSGDALYLDDLLADGREQLLASEHFTKIDETYKEEILSKTVIGAMKYYDLKFNKQQDYIFDWEFVLNTKGNSAPYLQNAYVRIDSIFYKKFGAEKPIFTNLNISELSPIGKDLFFNCQKMQEIISDLKENEYQSQTVTQQMMKISQLFHSFYEKEKILNSEKEGNSLSLLHEVTQILEKSSEILGISLYPCEQKMKKQKNNSLSI